MKMSDRAQALRALKRVFIDKVHLSHVMAEAPLTPFAKALCFGLCRYFLALEKIALLFLDKKPKDQEVWLVLLLGLYQLHYLSKPDFAVVQETVALLHVNKKWAKGLVNAVLRRYCREKAAIKPLSSIDSHPAWFVARLKKEWPLDWEAILCANDTHPPFSLRVNAQKIDREAYVQLLKEQRIEAKCLPHAPQGLVLETACDVTQLPGFKEGLFSVQDESSQYIVSQLALAPGLRLLDACCAPGGKLCHILETEPKLGYCLGLDADKKRISRVLENLTRLQLKAELSTADARLPDLWWDGHYFDRILLDAPCSALGVIRRHPDIKHLRSPEEIDAIVSVQAALLEALWPLLQEGGLMLYATCSLIKQENTDQIAAFLARHPEAALVPLEEPWGIATGFGWQILPGMSYGDGFFYSLLQKKKNLA